MGERKKGLPPRNAGQKMPAPQLSMVVTEFAAGIKNVGEMPMILTRWSSGSFAANLLFPHDVSGEICDAIEDQAMQIKRLESGIVLPAKNGDVDALADKMQGLRGEGQ